MYRGGRCVIVPSNAQYPTTVIQTAYRTHFNVFGRNVGNLIRRFYRQNRGAIELRFPGGATNLLMNAVLGDFPFVLHLIVRITVPAARLETAPTSACTATG